ncbi:MAG: MFS transporter [Planctomycetota bacterium]|jgi:MFS family permease
MEFLETIAYISVRAVAPLFLVAESSANGLQLTFNDKGNIFGLWAFVQCMVPLVSGGLTERYGYRRSLFVAFTLNIVGYFGMANAVEIAAWAAGLNISAPGYWTFLTASMFVATGTAVFKPPCHGSIAAGVSPNNATMGWGIFYWTVNVSSAIAPMIASSLRGTADWQRVFHVSAGVSILTLVVTALLFREAHQDQPPGARRLGVLPTIVHTLREIAQDKRLLAFLAIYACYWFTLMQLWDLMPNFIEDWVDTSAIAPIYAWIHEGWVLPSGQVKPEMLISIDPTAVVLLMLGVSMLVRKTRMHRAIIVGMTMSSLALIGMTSTRSGAVCAAMILLFALGEMICVPLFNAYIGQIAPRHRKAQYMGYANLPVAIGWAAGAKLSGTLYEHWGSKTTLARRYLVEQLGQSEESLTGLGATEVFDLLAQHLPTDVPASMNQIAELLWRTYHPQTPWYAIAGVGLLGTIGMILFKSADERR